MTTVLCREQECKHNSLGICQKKAIILERQKVHAAWCKDFE